MSKQLLTLPCQPLTSNAPLVEAHAAYPKTFRQHLPPHGPMPKLALWSIIKDAVSKGDLTRVSLPVNFSEPLSSLQRTGEECQYAGELLGQAAVWSDGQQLPEWKQLATEVGLTDAQMRLLIVAAFSVSAFGTMTPGRAGKPFNPLEGETYEYVTESFRLLAEQVSHHPPVSACWCEGVGFAYWSNWSGKPKFTGNALEVSFSNRNHVRFFEANEHISWIRPQFLVRNLLFGGATYAEVHGDSVLTNHASDDTIQLSFSHIKRDSRKLEGKLLDKNGKTVLLIEGEWNSLFQVRTSKSTFKIWEREPIPSDSAQDFHLPPFTLTLNDTCESLQKTIAPSDTRHRADQRLMEDGDYDAANKAKVDLEVWQRQRRRARLESLGVKSSEEALHQPRWFVLEKDPLTGDDMYIYRGGYWEARSKGEWPADVPKNLFSAA